MEIESIKSNLSKKLRISNAMKIDVLGMNVSYLNLMILLILKNLLLEIVRKQDNKKDRK